MAREALELYIKCKYSLEKAEKSYRRGPDTYRHTLKNEVMWMKIPNPYCNKTLPNEFKNAVKQWQKDELQQEKYDNTLVCIVIYHPARNKTWTSGSMLGKEALEIVRKFFWNGEGFFLENTYFGAGLLKCCTITVTKTAKFKLSNF